MSEEYLNQIFAMISIGVSQNLANGNTPMLIPSQLLVKKSIKGHGGNQMWN